MVDPKSTILFLKESDLASTCDAFLQQYNLSIHQIDGKRLLRWLRHIKDHQGEWNMDDIEALE